MWFSSDNAGPAAPEIMDALQKANQIYTSGYGADPIMDRVRDRIREVFEAPDAAVYLVPTGTAANALALSCLAEPYQTSFCHRNAHIEEDECGAPEFYSGAKLCLLEGADAKIDPTALKKAIQFTARAGVHNVQHGPLSITTATENGAVYSLDEIRALTELAKAHDLPVHLDGARFANALVRLGCSPAEMTWKSGVDALSFGGTKNGCMGVEAVILFNPDHAWEFELRRKRGGHLFSKHRYLSAQMEAYLSDDLWLRLARQANAMADRLAAGLRALPHVEILHPVDANMIFARFPRHLHRKLHDADAHYYFWPFDQSLEGPDNENLSCRLVCNWMTTEAEVDALLKIVAG